MPSKVDGKKSMRLKATSGVRATSTMNREELLSILANQLCEDGGGDGKRELQGQSIPLEVHIDNHDGGEAGDTKVGFGIHQTTIIRTTLHSVRNSMSRMPSAHRIEFSVIVAKRSPGPIAL